MSLNGEKSVQQRSNLYIEVLDHPIHGNQSVRIRLRSRIKTMCLGEGYVTRDEWDTFDQLYRRVGVVGGALAEHVNNRHGDNWDPVGVAAETDKLMRAYVRRMTK